MQSNHANDLAIETGKIQIILKLVFSSLMALEILKMIELSVVFMVKQNSALFVCLFAILVAIRSFSKRNVINLILLTFANFTLIFQFDIVNQHFAFLTSLLAIFLLEGLLSKTSLMKDDLYRITAILLVSQMCVLYLFAALWKVNPDYLTGMQMLEHIRTFLIFPNNENPQPIVYIGLSILGLTAELILSIQFMLRKIWLECVQTLGFLFHLSMVVLIGEDIRNSFQLFIFASAALMVYPLCDPRNWNESKLIVFWDEECDFCGRSVKFFRQLDQNLNFKYVSNTKLGQFEKLPFDGDLIRDTIVVFDPESHRYWIKSKAILYIVTHNYFFWFAKLLTRLPFVFKLTDKFYDRVAKQRTCHI
jgi:predicted DCC family thiol-disulfide oxidoreductase YuxK